MSQTHANGTTIHFRDEGHGDVLLLLHAFPLHLAMWEPQFAALAATMRVIAMDARGFGGSPEIPQALTMETLADDAAALLRALAVPRAIVCGLSMGGYGALALVRRHPELVRALVLADTRATPDSPEGKKNRESFAKNALENGEGWVSNELLPKLIRAKPDPAIATAVRGMIRTSTPAAIAAASRGLALRPDSSDLLPRISVPTLVIVGQEDVLTPPSDARAMAERIPGASLVEIPAAGHLSNLENPAAFNGAILEFTRTRLGPSHEIRAER